MSVDISTLNLQVRSDGVMIATGRLDDLAKKGKKAEESTESLTSSISKMSAFVQTAATGFAAWKLSQYIKDATLLAARVETLAVVMKVVGTNAGYTYAQMDTFTSGLKKMGITTQESMSSLIKMAGAQMDLTKSSKLARVAQDAAVIGGINSSEAFGRMIQGIRSGEVEILKTIGISVQFEQGYKQMAASIGKTSVELTNAEKTASRMNQVLDFGVNIAGAYEASMSTAGKQMLSMSRYAEELKLKVGEIFAPALTVAVTNFVTVLKEADAQVGRNKEGLKSFAQEMSNPMGVFTDLGSLLKGTYQTLTTLLDLTSRSPGMITVMGVAAYSAVGGVAGLSAAFVTLTSAIVAAMATNPVGWLAAVGASTYFATKSFVKSLDGITYAYTGLNLTGEAYYNAEMKRAKAADTAWENAKKKALFMYKEGGISSPLASQDPETKQIEASRIAAAAQKAKEDADAKIVSDAKSAARAEKAAREADRAAAAAEQWRVTYADLRKEIDSLAPGMDEYSKKVLDVDNKYRDLVGKYPQYTALLEATRAEMVAALTVQRDIATTEDARLTTEKRLSEEYERQLDHARDFANLQAANDTAAASLVGTNAIGGFDSVADETANKMAMEQDAHNKRMGWIDEERRANARLAQEGARSGKEYHDYIAKLDKDAAIEKQKHSKATGKIADEGYRSSLAAASTYTGMAADAFTMLASTQDQSSRSGFESAKALSLAAAVMSTASAIMAQLTIPGPAGWAAAALAAATGVIQIAKISSTSFGGGAGSVSAPAGSFGGGSGSGGFGATPMTSISDSTTQNSDAMIAAQDRNTLVIGKLSKTIEELNGLFQPGGAGDGLAANAPGKFTALGEGESAMGNLLEGMKTSITGAWKLSMDLFKDGSAYFTKTSQMLGLSSAFGIGNKYYTTAAGMSIGVNDGQFGVQDYTTKKKDGGYFTSSKTKTKYTDNADAGAYLNEVMRPFVNDLGTMADTLGFVFDPAKYKASAIKINTAGKTSEQIGEELSKLMATTLSGMTLTIDGLKGIVGSYEDAYTRIKQINDAWVTANEQLQLVGISPLAKGGGTAVNAENAQNSLYGGREGFIDAMQEYRDVMYTQPERDAQDAAAAQRTVNMAWMEITASAEGAGLTLPKTKAEFNALRATIDPNSPLFAALTGLGTAFATMTDAAEEAAKTLRDTFLDTALSAANALKDIMGGELSTLSPEEKYRAQQKAFADAQAAGRTAELPELGKALLTASRSYNGSSAGYTADYATVTAALADVAGMTDSPSLRAANAQVQLLTDIRAILDGGTGNLTALTGQLKYGTGIGNAMGTPDPNAYVGVSWFDKMFDSRKGRANNYNDNSDLIDEIRALKGEVVQLRQQSVGALNSIDTKARLAVNE